MNESKSCKGADESKSKKKAKARFADLHFAQICQQTKLQLSQLRRAFNANVEIQSITCMVPGSRLPCLLTYNIWIDIRNAELGNELGR